MNQNLSIEAPNRSFKKDWIIKYTPGIRIGPGGRNQTLGLKKEERKSVNNGLDQTNASHPKPGTHGLICP